VVVLGLRDRFTESDLPTWGAVPVRVHSVVGPKNLGFSPALSRSLRTAGLDLLHVHGIWMYPSIASLRLCRTTKLPLVISSHGMLDSWARRNSAWKKKIGWIYEGAHLRRANCLRALCEAEAESMRKLGLRNPICVIPNGQELPPQTSVVQPCDGLGFARDRKVLLFLSRLHPKKGLPNLLGAWANCQKTDLEARDWALVVAGADDWGHERVLRHLVSDLGIEKSVLFVGPLFGDKKARALQEAEASVLPSFSEGLPMTVLEAWAWRLPVLITPQCNLPEGFVEGAAVRADPTVDSLTLGLRTLFRMSDSDRKQMGERGRRLVEERFTWPRVAEQMVSVYKWLLGAGPKPHCVRE
jgi:glycosyltransferase involved in cell wall biosynthesis